MACGSNQIQDFLPDPEFSKWIQILTFSNKKQIEIALKPAVFALFIIKAVLRIQDPGSSDFLTSGNGMEKSRSGIRDNHPRSATLH
jgi:hypothetical protein